MAMIAFAGFVIIAQHANAAFDQRESVFETMVRTFCWLRKAPYDKLHESIFAYDMALVEQRLGPHVGVDTIIDVALSISPTLESAQ